MKNFFLILLVFAITSCIPVKIAPKFQNQDYKVMKAKKFQRKLPKETSFIFKDQKNADEFYYYINKKFNLNHKDVGFNVPFQIDGETLYLSYHEVEREDQTYNLALVIIDAKLSEDDGEKMFEDCYVSRKGHWYIILTVYDEIIKNCLRDNHPLKTKAIQYLKELKQEYPVKGNKRVLKKLMKQNQN